MNKINIWHVLTFLMGIAAAIEWAIVVDLYHKGDRPGVIIGFIVAVLYSFSSLFFYVSARQ